MPTETLNDLKRKYYTGQLGLTESVGLDMSLADLEKQFFETVSDPTKENFFGTQVNKGASITDANTAHALPALYDAASSNAALNALGTKINAVITRLETLNLITTV